MEARKITIVATREQKKYVINSEAETLGELKTDLRNAGINFSDMAFMEGLTRTEMKDDNSLLPKDVQRVNRETGETTTTNELVFMLTNVATKIKSGVSRSEVFKAVKDNNLQEVVKYILGKNFTQCKTDELLNIIEKYSTKSAPTEKESEVHLTIDSIQSPTVDHSARRAVNLIADTLYQDGYIEVDVYDSIISCLGNEVQVDYPEHSPYTDEEIDAMFKGL